MGAKDQNTIQDAIWIEKCKRIGRVWLILDTRVEDRMEKDEMDTFKISYKKRGGGWLVIIEGTIAGVKQVQFQDIADLSQAGGAVKSMLEEPKWRVSKPFDQITTKPNTDKIQ